MTSEHRVGYPRLGRPHHPGRRHLPARRGAQAGRLRRPAHDGQQGARRVRRGDRHHHRRPRTRCSPSVDRDHPGRQHRHQPGRPRRRTCAARDFLDAEKFPTLEYRSTGVKSRDGNEFVLTGELTIKGVTRPVDLEVEFEGVGRSPFGQDIFGFSASTEIDREDFGLTWNVALETGGVLVGKKIKIEIEGEAVRQA